jgi:hypothetical protein
MQNRILQNQVAPFIKSRLFASPSADILDLMGDNSCLHFTLYGLTSNILLIRICGDRVAEAALSMKILVGLLVVAQTKFRRPARTFLEQSARVLVRLQMRARKELWTYLTTPPLPSSPCLASDCNH